MFEELAGIDIDDFANKVKNDDTLSPEFKLGATILIQRYKLLIDCSIAEYKALTKCMGGTTKLLDSIEDNIRFEELSIDDKQLTIEDN